MKIVKFSQLSKVSGANDDDSHGGCEKEAGQAAARIIKISKSPSDRKDLCRLDVLSFSAAGCCGICL